MTDIRNTTIRSVSALLVLGVGLATARADELDGSTVSGIQHVVSEQLAAFARGDATTAESFAAPGIKARFPDPAMFLGMVRGAYAPLVTPRSTHFGKTASTAVGPSQMLSVIASDGSAWTALYTFEQVGGAWLISGCVLVKENSTDV